MPPTIQFDLHERAAHVADERWVSWLGVATHDITPEILEMNGLGHYMIPSSAPTLVAAEVGLGILEAGLTMRFGIETGDDSRVLHILGDPTELDEWAASWGFPT